MHNSHDPRVLPMRCGVRPSCVVLPCRGADAPWALTLDYLCQRLGAVSRAQWLQRMARGDVVDELGRPVQPDTPMLHGLRVYYYREVPPEPALPFAAQVLYRDAHLVVADKPHFLPVVPTGQHVQRSLLVQLRRELGLEELSPLHRIDRDTAGLVLLAVRRCDRGAYQALFRDRLVEKTYEAIAPFRVPGQEGAVALPRMYASHLRPSGDFIRMHEVPGEPPNSLTHLHLLEHNAHWGRYRLHPVSGKRHQLRVHMAALGRGIWGDALYPRVRDVAGQDYSRPLQLLAQSLRFTDPVTGQMRHFQSRRSLRPLPDAPEG